MARPNIQAVFVACAAMLAGCAVQPGPAGNLRTSERLTIDFLLSGQTFQSRSPDESLAASYIRELIAGLDPAGDILGEADMQGLEGRKGEVLAQLAARDMQMCRDAYALYRTRLQQRESYLLQVASGSHGAAGAEVPDQKLAARWQNILQSDRAFYRSAGLTAEESQVRLVGRYEAALQTASALDERDMFERCMKVVARTLDPHGDFMSSLRDGELAAELSLQGIGLLLQTDLAGARVTRLVKGGPAEQSGAIEPGDFIVGVAQADADFADVRGMPLDSIIRLLRGPSGSYVRLQVASQVRPAMSPVRVVTLRRGFVPLEMEQTSHRIVSAPHKGQEYRFMVLDIHDFHMPLNTGQAGASGVVHDISGVMDRIAQSPVDGLIIDLRGNPGGVLANVLDSAAFFIGARPVMRLAIAHGRNRVMAGQHASRTFAGPLVVLVDRQTGSGAEVFAAAIQDQGVGVVVGEGTAGKAAVRMFQQVPAGTVTATAGMLHRADGGVLENTGVTPDILIAGREAVSAPRPAMTSAATGMSSSGVAGRQAAVLARLRGSDRQDVLPPEFPGVASEDLGLRHAVALSVDYREMLGEQYGPVMDARAP